MKLKQKIKDVIKSDVTQSQVQAAVDAYFKANSKEPENKGPDAEEEPEVEPEAEPEAEPEEEAPEEKKPVVKPTPKAKAKAKTQVKAKAKVAEAKPKRAATSSSTTAASASAAPRPKAKRSSGKAASSFDTTDYDFNGDGFLEKYSVSVEGVSEPACVETELTAVDLLKMVIPERVNLEEYTKNYELFVDAVNSFKEDHKSLVSNNGRLFTKGNAKNPSSYMEGKTKKPLDGDMAEALKSWNEYNKKLDVKSKKLISPVTFEILQSPLMHTPFILSVASAVDSGITNTEFCYEKFDVPVSELNDREKELEAVKTYGEALIDEKAEGIEVRKTCLSISAITRFATNSRTIWKHRNGILHVADFTDELKKKCWMQAKANMDNMETNEKNEVIVKSWRNILASPFCYYIFMYGVEEGAYITLCINDLLKDSIKLFTEELYPISFIATPFMCGAEEIEFEPKCKYSEYYVKLGYIQENSNWFYFLLNHEEASFNKSIATIGEKQKEKLVKETK